MWVRGLKHGVLAGFNAADVSHPMWVRGLKHSDFMEHGRLRKVAPYVGAWIETILEGYTLILVAMSHPMWVRGLKRRKGERTRCG